MAQFLKVVGTLLVDNPMLEVYRTAADVPGTIPNPEPGPVTVSGDFNSDGSWDCMDIDALVAAVASGSTDLSFDMNGDGVINSADVTDAGSGWLAVGGANNPGATSGGNPFLIGDATLDGTVDGLDFIEWNNNKFSNLAEWCGGDFNVDGTVDGLDFIEWNRNKFTSSDSASSQPPVVPEPTGLLLLVGAVIVFVIRRSPA